MRPRFLETRDAFPAMRRGNRESCVRGVCVCARRQAFSIFRGISALSSTRGIGTAVGILDSAALRDLRGTPVKGLTHDFRDIASSLRRAAQFALG